MKKLKKIAYLGSLYSISSIFEKGISFLFIPIYTTYLGTADYGIMGIMMVTIGLCGSLFYPPVYQGFIRFYYSVEFKGQQGLLLFNSLLFIVIQALLFAAIFFGLSKIFAENILGNKDLIIIVQVYAFILFFQPLCDFLLAFLMQIEKAKLTIVVSSLHSLFYVGFVLFGLIVLKLGVMAMIYGLLFGYIFKICCILPIFWRESTHKISFQVLYQPLKYGYQRVMSGWSSLLIHSGDRYIILFFSTVSTVGLYSFGYQIASIINALFIAPLISAITPIIFKQEDNPAGQKEFIKKSTTYFYLVGMFICLFLSLYSKEIIEMLATKDEFWESWVVVPALVYCYLLSGMGIFFDWGLVMTKNGFRISAIVIFGAIINIGFNFILIPYWGILGAAYATLISYLVINGVRIYYSGIVYDLHFELSRLLHITLVGFGLFMLSLFIAYTGSLATDVGLKFLILLSFPFIIFMSGFFKPWEMVKMKNLWNSIRENGVRKTYSIFMALG